MRARLAQRYAWDPKARAEAMIASGIDPAVAWYWVSDGENNDVASLDVLAARGELQRHVDAALAFETEVCTACLTASTR